MCNLHGKPHKRVSVPDAPGILQRCRTAVSDKTGRRGKDTLGTVRTLPNREEKIHPQPDWFLKFPPVSGAGRRHRIKWCAGQKMEYRGRKETFLKKQRPSYRAGVRTEYSCGFRSGGNLLREKPAKHPPYPQGKYPSADWHSLRVLRPASGNRRLPLLILSSNTFRHCENR